MLFRYRARNFPQTLNQEERELWDRDRKARLVDTEDVDYFTVKDFKQIVAALREQRIGDLQALEILDKLESWVTETGLDGL